MLTLYQKILELLLNLLSTETLELPFITSMVQARTKIFITTQVNIKNPYPLKFQVTANLHT